jgi:hypothetical protein
VSIASGLLQVFPESAELAIRSEALLSRRTFHHAENTCWLLGIVRSDVVQSPGDGGMVVDRSESDTNSARPVESTKSRAGPRISLIGTGSLH